MVTRLSKKQQAAVEKIRRWREDPILFVRENFGVEPDAWQKDVLTNFAIKQRIAMVACKGPGKTAVEAWCMWNFMATRPEPKIVATSVTGENLSDNLWPELAKWQARSQFLKDTFLWTKTRVVNKQNPENWFMSARTWPKTGDPTQQADALAGIHADYVLFVLDESGGIPNAVMATAEAALASGVETKILQGGNPTELGGPLHRAATTERNLWHVVNITSDPEDPNRTPRVSAQWAREQIEKYGRDHPWVKINVLGQFPPSSLNALFSEDDIEAAFARKIPEDQYRYMQKRIGVDVARFGDDKTVIVARQGLRVFNWEKNILRNANSYEIANKVSQVAQDEKSEVEFVDDTGGYSAGAQDVYITLGRTMVPVNFSSKASDPRFMNLRAEIYWRFAEWVKRAALPRSTELKKALLATKYFFVGNKMQLVDKDIIKAEIGFSPDEADAIATTFATVDQQTAGDSIELVPGVRLSASQGMIYTNYRPQDADYDPFSDQKMAELFGKH